MRISGDFFEQKLLNGKKRYPSRWKRVRVKILRQADFQPLPECESNALPREKGY